MSSGVDSIEFLEKNLPQYEKEWAENMVVYWHEQMSRLHVIDSGKLYASVTGRITQNGGQTDIEHQFVEYGLNVEEGTGREFGYGRDDETGWIDVKDTTYREEHGLNKPRKKGPKWGGGYTSGMARQKKPWFNMKYLYSIYRLREHLQQEYGEQFQNMTLNALNEITKPLRGGQ